MIVIDKFEKVLRELREANNFSQEKLAKPSRSSRRTVFNRELPLMCYISESKFPVKEAPKPALPGSLLLR